MRARAGLVVATTALLALYLLVRAVDLFRTGTVPGALLGLGVVLLVGLGGLLVAGEVRLAAASQRLGTRLYAEGFVEEDLPLSRSGRVERAAADALFTRRKAEVEAAPEDWRAWFLLASAYDMARDPQRGRRAMRRAVALERLS
ncbi:MAG TPA: hypothetical protein VM097_10885 [Mycobacteriales bacterium]|nr:hypothetical protein [Mycobacteriales bacterium]